MNKSLYLYCVILVCLTLCSCQKKIIIAKIQLDENDSKKNSTFNDLQKIDKKQLLNTDFYIQIKNNTINAVEILKVEEKPSFYGVGCHFMFRKTLGNLICSSKLKLENKKCGDYYFPMKVELYKDDVLQDILDNVSADSLKIGPNQKISIKVNLSKQEFNEDELRKTIWFGDDNFIKKQNEKILNEQKLFFDNYWNISVFAHIFFAYRFSNAPDKVLLEHRTRIYEIMDGSDGLLNFLKNIDE